MLWETLCHSIVGYYPRPPSSFTYDIDLLYSVKSYITRFKKIDESENEANMIKWKIELVVLGFCLDTISLCAIKI